MLVKLNNHWLSTYQRIDAKVVKVYTIDFIKQNIIIAPVMIPRKTTMTNQTQTRICAYIDPSTIWHVILENWRETFKYFFSKNSTFLQISTWTKQKSLKRLQEPEERSLFSRRLKVPETLGGLTEERRLKLRMWDQAWFFENITSESDIECNLDWNK